MAIAEKNSDAEPRLRPKITIPTDFSTAILFGHADGDGHLAAEQSRDWLIQREFSVTTVVSSATRNYRFWEKLREFDLTDYQLVVTVDLAFRFKAPSESLGHLLSVSDSHPEKQFVIVDHHPIVVPSRPRENLQLIEVKDPYECCLGEPNPELMEVAALCDGAPTAVAPTALLTKRALGVKRAAADFRGVAGDQLLMLIRERRWEFFEQLADEDREMHRTVRGIRRTSSPTSPLLEYARNL